MPSPNRDSMSPNSGKMLDSGDQVVDFSAVVKKLDAVLSAVTGLKVDATIETGDIEIGAVEIKDGVTDARVTVETTGSDGTSNDQNNLTVTSRLKAFNGTTWDRLRSGITTVTSTLTGWLNTMPWAIYHLTPTTRTNGQGGPMEADASGNQLVTLGTLIEGEDSTNHVMKVEGQFNFNNITTQTTTTVKSGAGLLHAVILNTPVANAVITIYDNTAGSGTKIGTITLPAALLSDGPITVTLNAKFTTGCTIVTSGATMDIIALTR